MKKSMPYVSLPHTLKCLKDQVKDSMPFIGDYVPTTIKTPEELFYYLKTLVTYKNDPKGKELLQTVQCMMEGEYWGKTGRGDCDCFTILVLASCIYLGFDTDNLLYVALVGKGKKAPTHIYSLVDDNGVLTAMDLTNPYYGMERDNYKYRQILDFNTTGMMLELRDGGAPLACRTLRDGDGNPVVALSFGGRTRARHRLRQQMRLRRIEARELNREAVMRARADKKIRRMNRRFQGGDGPEQGAPDIPDMDTANFPDDTGSDFNPDVEQDGDSSVMVMPDDGGDDSMNDYYPLSAFHLPHFPKLFNKAQKKERKAEQVIQKAVAKEDKKDDTPPKKAPLPEKKGDSLMEKIQKNPVESAVIGAVVAWTVGKALDGAFSGRRRRRAF